MVFLFETIYIIYNYLDDGNRKILTPIVTIIFQINTYGILFYTKIQ